MVHPIFKNKKLQSLFERNGFVKVPLLTGNQADELMNFFRETSEEHAVAPGLHHTTTDTANIDLICRVDSKIKSIFLPELEKILQDFKPLVGCFHVKERGAGSATGFHQDPTFVDESQYCSANVWVALHDVDERNGNLTFIKGSNRAMKSLRITPTSPSYYESFNGSLPEMAVPVPMKKGEAVIFNNSTIHGATENLTDELRLAATLLVCSKNAEWMIYYRENAEDARIEKFHLDFNTFVSMPKNGRPDGKAFSEYISYEFPKITKNDFLERIGHGAEGSLFARIKDVLKITSA